MAKTENMLLELIKLRTEWQLFKPLPEFEPASWEPEIKHRTLLQYGARPIMPTPDELLLQELRQKLLYGNFDKTDELENNA